MYDILGNKIATLVDEEQSAGEYEVEFIPDNTQLVNGVYFYRLITDSVIRTKKMVLIR